jgi:hypothetical protein
MAPRGNSELDQYAAKSRQENSNAKLHVRRYALNYNGLPCLKYRIFFAAQMAEYYE